METHYSCEQALSRHILNQSELTNLMSKVVVPDYNDKRPHGSLNGLTPLEAYGKKKVNFKRMRERMIEAHKDRVNFNRTHSCYGCPFGCKCKTLAQITKSDSKSSVDNNFLR